MTRLIRLVAIGLLGFALGMAHPLHAVTQDFTLVNQTGVEVYRLFISETGNDSWEEDVLGNGTLPDGHRLDVSFSGRTACLWDMMVTDEDDNSLTWQAINLCEASVVVLRCNDEECWAEHE